MPLNLPNNPTIGQTVTEGSRAWFWNGRYWQATSLNVGYTGSQGDLGFTGSKGEQGNFGGVTLDYTYSDDNDSTLYPGAGRLKFNTRDMTQSQSLIIADSDDNTINLDSYLSTIAASTSDIRGHFKVTKKSYPEFFVMFAITGEIDTFDDYYVVPCSFVSGNLTDSSTAFEAEDDLLITFARTGDKGDTGYTGSQGAPGASVRLLGSVNTLQDLPQSPDVGDGYLVTDTGDLYIWNGSQYTNVGKITGETGPLGYTGSQGDQGPIGYTGSSGSGGGGGSTYISLVMTGTITTPFVGTSRFYPPKDLSITVVYASVTLATNSGAFTFVLKKNGVDIGATFSIAQGQNIMTPVSVNATLLTTDYLTLDVTGASATDLFVKIEYINT